jgi:subtilase family serine protease
LRHIDALDQINHLGQEQTIAIVDAYNDPNIVSDPYTFDKAMMRAKRVRAASAAQCVIF